MSTRTDEIAALVAEINAVEEGQRTRLNHLWDLVQAGRGGRWVHFNGAAGWGSLWGSPSALGHVAEVDPLIRLIAECNPGVD
jgi:hypothetical protein